jgi:hypothetical protein
MALTGRATLQVAVAGGRYILKPQNAQCGAAGERAAHHAAGGAGGYRDSPLRPLPPAGWPAYDLLCTRLAIPDDQLALPVGGRRDRLGARDFLALGAYAKLPERAALRVIGEVAGTLEEALGMVGRSPLGKESRKAYAELLRERAEALAVR